MGTVLFFDKTQPSLVSPINVYTARISSKIIYQNINNSMLTHLLPEWLPPTIKLVPL